MQSLLQDGDKIVKEQIYEQRQQGRTKNLPTADTHKNNCGKALCVALPDRG